MENWGMISYEKSLLEDLQDVREATRRFAPAGAVWVSNKEGDVRTKARKCRSVQKGKSWFFFFSV